MLSEVAVEAEVAVEVAAEVEVSGLTEDIDDDFLLLYFENKRRSGGGGIRSFSRNGSAAIIIFSDPADAEAVLSGRKHCLHHVTVEVRRPPPWDLRKAMLCGLDSNTEEALLELYVEAVTARDSITILRSADRASALLSFQEELSDRDFHGLVTRVAEKKLQGRVMSVGRVRVGAEVLVENMAAQASAELLEMYFESKRSGGGQVKAVTMLRGNSAIISFCDWKVVDDVLCRSHFLQNNHLCVSRYYPDMLGNPIPDQDRDMEEEESAESLEIANTRQSHRQDIGAPAEEEASIDRTEETCDLGEETSHKPAETSHKPAETSHKPAETSHKPAETSHKPAETSQIRGDDPDAGRLPESLRSPLSWGDEGRGVTAGEVHEAEVIMEAAELLFMQRYQHELLAGMDAVTIFPLEEDGKFGFKVIGDAFSCRNTVELLQHIVSSLSSRTVTLEYPGVSHFLLESEGQRTLRDTERLHQCVIDTSLISWNVLDCVYVDPWSFIHDTAATELSPVQPMITDEAPDNPLLHADMEGIKMFASLLKSEEKANDAPTNESSATIGHRIDREGSEEDLYTDQSLKECDSTSAGVKDEELDQVCQMSRKEYQDRELDEEAQLLLAIQRSMDSQGVSAQENEDELQRVLEMSLIQQCDDTEESLQRALEMSLLEQRPHDYHQPMRALEDPAEVTSDLAPIRVLAGDETSIVVASAALRKAITSKLNSVSLEGAEGLQNIAPILSALQNKHKVKITKFGRELQIQGFLLGPSQCRQEMSQILNALQVRGQAEAEEMSLDIDSEVEMIEVPDTSEEYQRVTQPFLNTLEDLKLSIEILQVQKVHNPLLYNQYQMKKLRTVMSDPDKPAERILYHGTTETSAREICRDGFNRSFSGKNAALYGQGVYFAVESEVSSRDHFSPPNQEGKKFVLAARVLTGEFTLGKESMRIPPEMPHPTGELPRRYDSLVNNMTHPTVYVIFNDTQAYPQYLITCRNHKPPRAR